MLSPSCWRLNSSTIALGRKRTTAASNTALFLLAPSGDQTNYEEENVSKIRMAGGRADTAAGTPCIGADATLLCSDGLGCSTDFLLIPNSGGQGFLMKPFFGKYCVLVFW